MPLIARRECHAGDHPTRVFERADPRVFDRRSVDAYFTARKGNVLSDRILCYGASTGRGAVDSIDDNNNNIQDVRVIPEGGFAQDWTRITGLSVDRILYYGASVGRGVIGSIDDDNNLEDVRVIPRGSFAQDWTRITGLRPGGSGAGEHAPCHRAPRCEISCAAASAGRVTGSSPSRKVRAANADGAEYAFQTLVELRCDRRLLADPFGSTAESDRGAHCRRRTQGRSNVSRWHRAHGSPGFTAWPPGPRLFSPPACHRPLPLIFLR